MDGRYLGHTAYVEVAELVNPRVGIGNRRFLVESVRITYVKLRDRWRWVSQLTPRGLYPQDEGQGQVS